MSITLAELKTQARQRADMENSEFVSDAELTAYVNSSLAELHDLLIAAYNEDYYMEEYVFQSDGTSVSYDLPSDVYKLRGVDVRQGQTGDWATVKRYNFNRRNEQQNAYTWNLLGLPYLEYRLVGSKIRFNRIADQNNQFRLFYYPRSVQLTQNSDVFDDINGYAEYVIVDCAIKMLNKEESDTSVLLGQKAALKARIEGMADNRDANEPESVTDVYAEDAEITLVGRR